MHNISYNKHRITFLIILSFLSFCLIAQENLNKAEDFLRYNQSEEAISLLLPMTQISKPDDKVFLYLSLAYEQIGDYVKAVEALQNGLDRGVTNPSLFSFNIGNNYYRTGQFEAAEMAFGIAIAENYGYADAYLNRANTRIQLSNWEGAVEDYKLYLTLRPSASQRTEIEAMINALTRQIQDEIQRLADEEERRKREEEARKYAEEQAEKAEAARLAREEELRRQEEERQAALLDNIFSSLEDISQDTLNLSADSEDIEDYESDLDLAD